jgi:hypothetical protein
MALSLNSYGQPFSENVITSNFPSPKRIKSVDLDGNGYVDIVALGSSGIAWFQNSAGTFSGKKWILNNIPEISDMEVIDYDDDNDIDIIGCSYSDSLLFWLKNEGTGSFSLHVISDTLKFVGNLLAGDAEGDGDVDIFYTIYDMGFENLYLYRNTGVGYTNSYVDRGSYSRDIFAFDYGNDGDLDILTVENYLPFDTDELYWLVNDGSNSFSRSMIYETDNIVITDAHYVDVDNNGVKDIVIANYTDKEIYWLVNGSSVRRDMVINCQVDDICVADFNEDGIKDLIYKNSATGNYYFYYLQGANP